MTTSSQDAPTTETSVPEACANCGTVLAADQRYCLNCGDRRSEARLDFIDILSEDAAGREAAVLPAAVAGSEKTGAEGWIRHNAGVLSLIAVVLLAAVGGVVVGRAIDGPHSSSSTAKPPVITVEGAAGSSSDDSAATGSDASSDSADASASDSGKAEKGGSGSTKGVQSADSQSSKDIEKSVDKGEPLSTGDGDLPATDDKAAGGGSDFETIQ
jgi:hypothetical protein